VETGINAERAVEAGEALAARELVERLLGQLKPEDQLVIRLFELEQKSLVEIREITGWSIAVIKVRAFRARRKLRKLFIELERHERT